jgi:Ca2+-binding RTX toxin-like protein
MFGASGAPSGFDLDSIMLSRTLLTSVDDSIDINSNTILPKLDVFDFSDGGIDFRPGTQRGFAEPDLSGVINSTIILDAQHLGVRDAVGSGPVGNTSLGDGGQITFNLTQAVSTNQPLYLYVGEDGAVGETLDGSISVSDQRTDAPTDLSTDFGHVGAEDDTISMTYTFTANSTDVDTLLFDFMFFSEELVEFAGSEFNDTFKIMLNGVNMAVLSDGAAASVNALKAAPFAPNHPDLILNPEGTGPTADSMRADAYTKLLTFAGALQDGVNTLTIEVADVRDGLLDSGIMVKGGTMRAGFSGGGFGAGAAGPDATTPQVTEGGPSIFIPITINPGGSGVLTEAVTVTFTAGHDLDLGNGPGVPLQVTFNPGSSLTYSLEVKALNDGLIEGSEFGVIDVTLTSADPVFNNLAVAPIVVEILDAPPAGVGLSVAFGTATAPSQWYLTSATTGISPIDIAPLPGPKPAVNPLLNMLTAGSTGPWSNTLLFDGRILANTSGDTDTFDVVGLWNSVPNFQAKSVEAEKMVFDGFTHVDASVGTASTEDSELILEGVMRANLVTGAGDDRIDIKFLSSQSTAGLSDDFRIFTYGGDDFIRLRSFNFRSELANGDTTYSGVEGVPGDQFRNNLVSTRSYIEAGGGDDSVLAGNGRDSIGLGDGDDFAYGDRGNDTIRGESGDDHIRGGPGDDLVMGDDGNDDIGGAEGDDMLIGGDGNDTIQAGDLGDDTFTGGEGADLFKFAVEFGIGHDAITDFEGGKGIVDRIDLRGVPILQNFQSLKALMSQIGDNVVIDLSTLTGGADTITLENTRRGDLVADDFLI